MPTACSTGWASRTRGRERRVRKGFVAGRGGAGRTCPGGRSGAGHERRLGLAAVVSGPGQAAVGTDRGCGRSSRHPGDDRVYLGIRHLFFAPVRTSLNVMVVDERWGNICRGPVTAAGSPTRSQGLAAGAVASQGSCHSPAAWNRSRTSAGTGFRYSTSSSSQRRSKSVSVVQSASASARRASAM